MYNRDHLQTRRYIIIIIQEINYEPETSLGNSNDKMAMVDYLHGTFDHKLNFTQKDSEG